MLKKITLLFLYLVSCGNFGHTELPPANELKRNAENVVSLSGSADCKAETKKVDENPLKASSIAEKAAEQAKAANDAQPGAAQKAAIQVKEQLAEKAEEAAEAAEAAFAGKQAVVDQLEGEIHEADDVIKEESASLPDAEQHVQAAQQAVRLATQEERALQEAFAMIQSLIRQTEESAQGAQQELSEKEQLVDQAKHRIETLKAQCNTAHLDLERTKEAEAKAVQAAKSASDNANH